MWGFLIVLTYSVGRDLHLVQPFTIGISNNNELCKGLNTIDSNLSMVSEESKKSHSQIIKQVTYTLSCPSVGLKW